MTLCDVRRFGAIAPSVFAYILFCHAFFLHPKALSAKSKKRQTLHQRELFRSWHGTEHHC